MEMGEKNSQISGRQTMNLSHCKYQYPLDLFLLNLLISSKNQTKSLTSDMCPERVKRCVH